MRRAPLQRTLKGVERLGLRVDVADLKGHVPNLGLAPDQRVLVVEGDYVLDGRILRTLLAQSAECVVAYDSKPSSTQGVPVRVEDDQLQTIGAGVAADTGRYVGATVCPGRTLSPLREWVDGGWAGRLQALTHTQSIVALDVAAIDPYVPGSRRAVRPLWFRIQTQADAQSCKDALVESAQKGTLDIMAWYVHRPIENWIVRHIADLPITPNQMSVLTSLVVFL